MEYTPKTEVIWAHNCGRASANQIKTLLARYPNLLCDLGGMMATADSGYGHYWPRKTPWMHLIEAGGRLFPEMKELYETFPDRFLLGTTVARRKLTSRALSISNISGISRSMFLRVCSRAPRMMMPSGAMAASLQELEMLPPVLV